MLFEEAKRLCEYLLDHHVHALISDETDDSVGMNNNYGVYITIGDKWYALESMSSGPDKFIVSYGFKGE